MLILTRRVGEKIRIGDEVTVAIVGVHDGNAVRIGVDAPKSLPVQREEIYEPAVPERAAAPTGNS